MRKTYLFFITALLAATAFSGCAMNRTSVSSAPLIPVVSTIPEPEPEPQVELEECDKEFYILAATSGSDDPLKPSTAVNSYERGMVVKAVAVDKTTGWYKLDTDEFIEPQYLNEGPVEKLDKTMYVIKECNIRSGPGTDYKKLGKYEEVGAEVHVTGVDILTGWYQIDDEKYVGSSNLIEERVEPMDEELYLVKKCNVRKGPSTDYDIVKEYYSGSKVHVTGKDIITGWYRLEGNVYVGSSNLSDRIPTLANATSSPKKIKYSWTTWDRKYSYKWSLTIDEELYNYYKGLKRNGTFSTGNDLNKYFEEESNAFYVKAIADMIKDIGKKHKYSKEQMAQEAVWFIQQIPYKTDKKSRKVVEWTKYAIETLYDNAGDCEDTALLTAGVLKELGFEVALLELPEHAAVGVAGGKFSGIYYDHNGTKYFYVETTGAGWAIGQIPDDFKSTNATLHFLNK